ncbi:MAG: AAA family ATPase [Pseudomonadota bacterium]
MKKSSCLYLKSLRLQNVVTFENQEITFDPSFNAIIGETGSGKSLILEALELILGQRADRKIIRKNATFATIEAVFHTEGNLISQFFQELGLPFEGHEVVIKRIIYPTENSKSYLNFQLCTLQELGLFARRFIDLVGQFENQKLLSEEYQLSLLDAYAKLGEKNKSYHSFYSQWLTLQDKCNKLIEDQSARKQREDYLLYQIQEIETLNPSVEDEQSLLGQKLDLQSREKRKQATQHVLEILSERESHNVLTGIQNALQLLHKEPNLFPEMIVARLEEAHQNIQDISFELSKNLKLDDGEESLVAILDRLDSYQKLKAKFGGDTTQVIAAYQSFKKEYQGLQGLEQNIADLQKEISLVQKEVYHIGMEIHQVRLHAAEQLSKELTTVIRKLKMTGAKVNLQLTLSDQPRNNGLDHLDFLVETNSGDGYFRISDVASGGELSRILLAFRKVLSANESISIFFFDEIDSGIGGETALAVGQTLKDVSEHSQVMAITHLPQLAHYADRLIQVSKLLQQTNDGPKTTSQVKEIFGQSKEEHVRSMTPL